MAQQRSFQIWNENSVEAGISTKTYLDVAGKIHYTPWNNRLDLKYANFYIFNELNNWFELGGGYRIAGINRDYDWLTEQRLMVVGNIFKDSETLEFNFSNRFEYRIFDKTANHFRHKQKFTVNFPVLTAWNLRFFVAEETFEKFTSENLHIIRAYGGLQLFELQYLQMKLYYILEKYKKEETWNTRDIFGLNVSIEV